MKRGLSIVVPVLLAAIFCGCRSSEPSVTSTPFSNTTSTPFSNNVATNPLAELESDLRQAAIDGEIETVKSLLAQGVNINAGDERGWTALRGAVFVENAQVVKLLLDRKAEPNIRAKDDGTTALHQAASSDSIEILKALLKSRADPNVQDSLSGMTPLMDTAGLRNVTATQLMIENKADVNIRDKWGETVLDQVLKSHESAIRSGRRSEAHNLGRVVKLLEKANAK